MKKKIIATLLATALMASTIAGCGSTGSESSSDGSSTSEESGEKETVKLTVWGAEEDQTLLQEMINSFTEEYADKADFDISLGVESEATAKDTVLTDVEAAADVFAFAHDQLNTLVEAGALQEVTLDTDKIIEENGGADSATIQAASYKDTLYAYPMTADNGYFMFYNKEYLSEEDVASLDTMLQVAEENGKYVSMSIDDAWYIYSFFQGAGLDLTLNDDLLTNSCDWNSTSNKYTGVDVANAIMNITSSKGFENVTDAEFATGVADGSIIAGVSGTWNATTASEAWGDNYAACKLPTYTVNGDQVQMASFSGYKLVGVNPYSDNAGYAMLLAQWLTNYDNQMLRFEQRGLGPSNVEAASSDAVQQDQAIAALSEQAEFSGVQNIGDNYWDPAATLGAIFVSGNPDGTDVQSLLDSAVEGITAPAQ